MPVDPTSACELSQIAREIRADGFRYPSGTGGRQLSALDRNEYLDRYRSQQPVMILAPVRPASRPGLTCAICGFVYDELEECPRCKLASEQGFLALPDDMVRGGG